MRFRTLALGLSAGIATGYLGFVGYKTYAVARELVDPPFYKPQPLARVEATYAELAAGQDSVPGGVWRARTVDHLQLWTLDRRGPTRGHVLLLHGFGDDRWGTSPALRWFPDLDASIFTYRRRDDALRAGGPVPPVTFGAQESEEVVRVVHALEAEGVPRARLVLMGRSLGASVGLLALAKLEAEGRGPLGGILWEGAPASSPSFAERLVRGPKDRWWHGPVAPLAGSLAAWLAGRWGGYAPKATDVVFQTQGRQFATPSLAFVATQDRLAPEAVQRSLAGRFKRSQIIAVPTWHLNTSVVLGSRYAEHLQEAVRSWLPELREPQR